MAFGKGVELQLWKYNNKGVIQIQSGEVAAEVDYYMILILILGMILILGVRS